jgi:hypothetical protein
MIIDWHWHDDAEHFVRDAGRIRRHPKAHQSGDRHGELLSSEEFIFIFIFCPRGNLVTVADSLMRFTCPVSRRHNWSRGCRGDVLLGTPAQPAPVRARRAARHNQGVTRVNLHRHPNSAHPGRRARLCVRSFLVRASFFSILGR